MTSPPSAISSQTLASHPVHLPGRTGIELCPALFQPIFDRFGSDPKLMLNLIIWVEKQSSYRFSVGIFNSMIKVLSRARECDFSWTLILGRLKQGIEGLDNYTFVILIRRYARAGTPSPVVGTLEFVQDPSWVQSTRVDNIVLHRWCRSRQLEHVERLWDEMKKNSVKPSVVTYRTLVKGYCHMDRVEVAIGLVVEMRMAGIEPNSSKSGKIGEALNLYTKIMESGYAPDRLTYNLLMNFLCKQERLDLAMQVRNEMKTREFDLDTSARTVLVHLLCTMHSFEEEQRMFKMASKLCDLMPSVPHSIELPNAYARDEDASCARRTSIMWKAKGMSDTLKTCRDLREPVKLRCRLKNVQSDVSVAD
ncbi:hypothetical protein Acr_06g0007870 [Actinidia rufa]|uniref:Tetratricopeptide repeat (TPR)-like superfamily protein n=1 Tax=Actinidia rufa TaxID=165716 RepID=A0A7J0ETE1_9ERIC|nr:hypothetical protein Acr_06g0007870 [Actinidia rufa]